MAVRIRDDRGPGRSGHAPHRTRRRVAIGAPVATALLLLGTLATRCTAKGVGPDADAGPLRSLAGQPDGKLFVAISRDGRRVAAGGSGGRLAAWDAETGRRLWIDGHRSFINSVALSPDGDRLASGGPARTVEIRGGGHVSGRHEGAVIHTWDVETGRRQATIGPASIPNDLAFDSTGSKLISIHPGNDPAVWNPATGILVAALGRSDVPSRAFSGQVQQRYDVDPEGRHTVALVHSIQAMEWWDIPATEQRAIDFDPTEWPPICITLDATGIIAATLDLRQSLAIYDMTAGRSVGRRPPAGTGERPEHPVVLAFSPDGGRIVSGDVGGVVRIWDADSDDPPRVVAGPEGHVRAFAFIAGGATIRVVSGGWLAPRDGPASFEPLRVWEIDLTE